MERKKLIEYFIDDYDKLLCYNNATFHAHNCKNSHSIKTYMVTSKWPHLIDTGLDGMQDTLLTIGWHVGSTL